MHVYVCIYVCTPVCVMCVCLHMCVYAFLCIYLLYIISLRQSLAEPRTMLAASKHHCTPHSVRLWSAATLGFVLVGAGNSNVSVPVYVASTLTH